MSAIRRPLPRQTDPEKVFALVESMAEEGQMVPINVLEVEGEYYSFQGCHRFEALTQLRADRVYSRIIKSSKASLRLQMR